MMRGITYDDNYIARKMHNMDPMPSYNSPMPSYGGYQDTGLLGDKENAYGGDEILDDKLSSPLGRPGYAPSSKTQLILNRVALSQPRGYSPSVRGYPPRMGPPPPAYYDYDYGYNYGGYGGYRPYGCGYNYGYPPPPPPPRYRNYDPYMEDEYDMNYVPRYRPSRMSDALLEIEKDRLRSSVSPVKTTAIKATTSNAALPASDYMAKHFSPGMLQAQVDKMRNRLHAMSYSLDPSGPVPELEPRHEGPKKYSAGPKHLACVDYVGNVPQWKRRAMTRFPSEDPNNLSELSRIEIKDAEETAERDPERLILKDRLSMRIHNYFSDSLPPEKFQRYLKTYRQPGSHCDQLQYRRALPTYKSKFGSSRAGDDSSKWEEPGAVYTKSSDYRPFSKTQEVVEEDEQKKERRRKKKSKEREEPLAIESSPKAEPTTPDSAPADDTEGAELDEKEKKRLEKKKRKAEREAAAKAAMEAELAALAEAEAELARLEAESAGVKKPQELKTESSLTKCPEVEPAKEPEPAPEVKSSEETADKCESSVVENIEPECLPKESEPSNLSSSDIAEENLQEHVDEPVKPPGNDQDLSTPVESEPIEQVTQQHEEASNVAVDERSKSPAPSYDNDNLPTYKTEARLWDESEATSGDAGEGMPPSTGDGLEIEKGGADDTEVTAEEKAEEFIHQEPEEQQSVDQMQEVEDQSIQEAEIKPEEIEPENVEDTQEFQDIEEQSFWTGNEEEPMARKKPVEQLEIEEIEDVEQTQDSELNTSEQLPVETSETIEEPVSEETVQEPAYEEPVPEPVSEEPLNESDLQETINDSETVEPAQESLETEQELEPEPNMDDVPLETDVDIFAGRDD